jgi:hypothetical protein
MTRNQRPNPVPTPPPDTPVPSPQQPDDAPPSPFTGNDEQAGNRARYRDRPADEGKHGDAGEEPNEGVPHDPPPP